MQRRTFLAANAGLAAATFMAVDRAHVMAQDATPGAIVANEIAPGVTAEVLAAAPSVVAPGQTAYVARFTFQSGMAIFPHSHPGTTVLGVSEGSLGWTLVQGVAHVVHGAGGANPSPVQDLTEPGADIVLEPGDAIYYEDDVVHTARGAGDTAAVVLATLILKAGAPLLMPMNMDMGTPGT